MKNVVTKKKPKLFKLVRMSVRLFFHKRTFIGLENLPKEPSLIIGNHAQLYGPITSEIYFPTKKYIWCTGEMMKLSEVPAYAFQDFWSLKPKYTKWFYKILSYLIAPISAYIFTRADTIPVYRDTRLIRTYKESLAKMNEGAHIIIFPECPKEYNNIINEFQDKYIDTARLYYKKTGKCIDFVPMYNAVKLKKILLGKPIKFNPNNPIEEERKRINDYLKQEITTLGISLPVHTVIPYSNIKKKEYPKSK